MFVEVEVCSKPPQLRGSSSGNMCTLAEEHEEAEQAGSVEQPSAALHNPAKGRSRPHKPSLSHPGRRGSSHTMRAHTGDSHASGPTCGNNMALLLVSG